MKYKTKSDEIVEAFLVKKVDKDAHGALTDVRVAGDNGENLTIPLPVGQFKHHEKENLAGTYYTRTEDGDVAFVPAEHFAKEYSEVVEKEKTDKPKKAEGGKKAKKG